MDQRERDTEERAFPLRFGAQELADPRDLRGLPGRVAAIASHDVVATQQMRLIQRPTRNGIELKIIQIVRTWRSTCTPRNNPPTGAMVVLAPSRYAFQAG